MKEADDESEAEEALIALASIDITIRPVYCLYKVGTIWRIIFIVDASKPVEHAPIYTSLFFFFFSRV
jgi:hypothetical protein